MEASKYHIASGLLATSRRQPLDEDDSAAEVAAIKELRRHHTESKGDMQHVSDDLDDLADGSD